jgi:hypothetical protein
MPCKGRRFQSIVIYGINWLLEHIPKEAHGNVFVVVLFQRYFFVGYLKKNGSFRESHHNNYRKRRIAEKIIFQPAGKWKGKAMIADRGRPATQRQEKWQKIIVSS